MNRRENDPLCSINNLSVFESSVQLRFILYRFEDISETAYLKTHWKFENLKRRIALF